MENVLQQKLIEVAGVVEKQIDSELDKLDNVDINDLDKLRENRLKELKKQHQQKQNWLRLGHGEMTELTAEKEFFEVSKNSDNIVCLFYKNSSEPCKVLDHHLKILAKQHIEAKFCKLNVDKCPFLTGRLKIRHIPTIALVVNNKIKDYVVGLSDFGNREDFPTEALEYRLSQSEVITYNGDFQKTLKQTYLSHFVKSKTIRSKSSDDSDED